MKELIILLHNNCMTFVNLFFFHLLFNTWYKLRQGSQKNKIMLITNE